MKLFQYWDTGSPPDEVAEWIDGFRVKNPDLKHRLYDRDSASWFIRKHIGEREQRAFDAIAVPAMQADYFRYCAIVAKGGIYVDADFQCERPLDTLLARAPHALLLVWEGHLMNGFIMTRTSRHPCLSACLSFATENIELRRFTSPYRVTGPALMTSIWALAEGVTTARTVPPENPMELNWDLEEVLEPARAAIPLTPELLSAFHAITRMHVLSAAKWLGTRQPQYKRTARHWVHWKAPLYLT